MLDRRLREPDKKTIKADRQNTLSANFFDRKPHYIKQGISSLRNWNPSLHLIRKQKLLFATADMVTIDPHAHESFLN